ncbi:hypothetical protein BKA83DRAFT_4120808 [Pisolithus microcarpus]|nr:hypothetical protein BKA83DRAFT_4120808 [Pisolithus microcarpus]
MYMDIIAWPGVTERPTTSIKSPLSPWIVHLIIVFYTLLGYLLMADHADVSTQFTEDAFAKQDHHCEQPKCGQLICQGEPEFYIATIEPAAARVNTSNSSSSIPPGNHAPPDALKIQKSVNAGQHGLSVSHSPDVTVPSAWLAEHKPLPLSQPGYTSQQAVPGAGPMLLPTMLPPRLGYTSQHSCYSQEYDWWSEVWPQPKYTIRWKKDIDAHICAHDLVPIALETIIPKVKKFCPMFPWRFDDFTVRDTDWVNLGAHHSLLPYFYSQCLQPARKNAREMAFKPKQFTLYVVVPAVQWLEYEAFMERKDSATITSKDTSDDGETSSVHVPSTVASSTTGDTMNMVNRPFEMHLTQTTFMPAWISAQVATQDDEPADTHDGVIAMTPPTPPPATMSPPRKTPTLTPFMSPSRTELWEALKSGGTSELNDPM